jgi:pilus assembly protein CpaE
VVDLDLRFGGVGTHLGLEGQYGIADLLERGEAVDANLVNSIAAHHDDGIDALLSPVSVNFEDPAGLRAEHMKDALRVFRDAYPATVIDAPALMPEAAAALSKLSTHVLIVLQPSVKDLPIARALLGSLRNRAVTTPVSVVTNRVRKRGEVSLADVKSALQLEEDPFVLPDDPRSALHALTEGKTLRGLSKSPLRKRLAALAESISTAEEEEEPPQPSRTRKRGGRRKAA